MIRHDSATQGKSFAYEYDAGGNILSKSEYDYTTGELGAALHTVSYTYGDSSWGDLLTAYNGQAITYDAIGNPTSYLGWNMTWQGRQLASATKDENALSFTYDANGIRTSKTVNGVKTEYLLNGTQILAQKTGSNTLCFFYDQQGNRVGMADSSNHFYYYLYNLQGDVIAIADASTGKLAATYTYDAWGKIVKINGIDPDSVAESSIAKINPFRYRGYYYDTETGLYYLNSRYYDPEVGRFINVDSVLGGNDNLLSFNLFAYCGNNPINRVDPTGQSFIAIAGLVALVGGIIFGCTGSSSVTAAEKTPIDPSVPPPPSSGYVPPKKNPNPGKVPNPNGSGKGWPSEGGGVWVPDNKQHGGPGWTEQFPGGKHKHHYPDGHVREISPEPINLDPLIGTGLVIAGIAASTYIIVNDITGVGVADDWLLGPAGGLITKGGILIFG